jgi:DNA-directed RNA polymerase subunit alpha
VSQSARILTQHLSPLCELGKPTPEELLAEPYDMPIEQLGVSSRTLNSLRRNKIAKVGDILGKSKEELLSMKSFGQRSLEEVWGSLEALGLVPKAAEEGVSPEEETEEERAIRELQAKGFKVRKGK